MCASEGENECVFVLLRAWQCPQWCHPERFSSSSAMTKMSNDTHIRSHPHHTFRSSHLCRGIWALWDTAGEEEWEMTLRSFTMCVPCVSFFFLLIFFLYKNDDMTRDSDKVLFRTAKQVKLFSNSVFIQHKISIYLEKNSNLACSVIFVFFSNLSLPGT